MKVRGTYKIGVDVLKSAKEDMIIMHPLPKVDEIDDEVDDTPHARYFQQVWNGIAMRMALLALILEQQNELRVVMIALLLSLAT